MLGLMRLIKILEVIIILIVAAKETLLGLMRLIKILEVIIIQIVAVRDYAWSYETYQDS